MTRQRKFWGWGFADEGASEAEVEMLGALAAQRFGVDALSVTPPPKADEVSLAAPRITPPESLKPIVTDDRHERLVHALGRSFPDQVKPFLRDFASAPDLVAYPGDEADVADLMDWAGAKGIALVPFGGGSSVVGGVTLSIAVRARGSQQSTGRSPRPLLLRRS